VDFPRPSDRADADLRLLLQQAFEIVRVGRQQDGRRAIADGCRCDQRVDPVVGLRQMAQSAGTTCDRFVGRLQHASCPLEHAENSIHLGVATSIPRRTLNEDGSWNADRAVVIEDPT
jgi:hypothetical protein